MLVMRINNMVPKTHRTPGLCKQMQGVVSGTKPNLNVGEAQELEELIAEYQESIVTKSDNYR